MGLAVVYRVRGRVRTEDRVRVKVRGRGRVTGCVDQD